MDNNRFARAKDLSLWLPVVAVVLFWVFYLLPGAVESSDVRGPQDYLADSAFSKGLLFWVFVFSPVTLICLAWGYFGQWMVRRNNILYLSIVAVMILCSFFPPVGILAMYSVILLSIQYIYSQKDGFHLFDKRKLMVLGALSSLYVLFLEISVYWHLSSVFNLGLLACMLPMLYWLSAAVFCRQPRGRLSWLLAFVAIALTVAAVILGQLNGYVFLWMVLPLVVALGLYNHCCKHLSNKIIGLSLCLLLASCSDRSLEQLGYMTPLDYCKSMFSFDY